MRVDQFYNRLPYPLHPRPISWARPYQSLCARPPQRILHAGCATGSQTRALAHAFPEAEIVGVDFADSSLELARKWLSEPEMRRVRFEKADLRQPLDQFGRFDFILSYGVLHHIPEVDRALDNIRAVLAGDDSPLVLFVYGKYGRSRIAQLQQALAAWQEAVPGLSERDLLAALWAAARDNGSFRGLRGMAKLALVLGSQYWRRAWESSNSDAYLHPYVRYYDLDDILALLDRHRMRFGGWVRRQDSAKVGFPSDEEQLLRRFKLTRSNELDERRRMSIADKLAAPSEYEFYCTRA